MGCFSRGERGIFTFENHRWLFRAARDLLFPHCVSGGLSAHPHETFLSDNKQKNTKHMSESHVFVFSWLLPHLYDQCCPSPAQLHFQLRGHLVAKCWVYWNIWGHFHAFLEVYVTQWDKLVQFPIQMHLYLLFLIEEVSMLIVVLEVFGWILFPALSLFLLDSPKGPEFHTCGKIWQVGHQPCWSGGTWSSVASFWLVSVFCIWGFRVFSPELLPHSSCMKTEASSGWYLSWSHLRVKNPFPVYSSGSSAQPFPCIRFWKGAPFTSFQALWRHLSSDLTNRYR